MESSALCLVLKESREQALSRGRRFCQTLRPPTTISVSLRQQETTGWVRNGIVPSGSNVGFSFRVGRKHSNPKVVYGKEHIFS